MRLSRGYGWGEWVRIDKEAKEILANRDHIKLHGSYIAIDDENDLKSLFDLLLALYRLEPYDSLYVEIVWRAEQGGDENSR